MEKEQIYKKAIIAWGIHAQLDMAVEECAELIKAIQKRKRITDMPMLVDSILEEMADVEIMLEQLKVIYDYSDIVSKSRFEQLKEFKLKRLLERLQ